MNLPILEVQNLSFSYPGIQKDQQILKDLTFSLNVAESLGIIGPNGGGKSTLLKILSGLLSFQIGKIIFDGKIFTKRVSSSQIDYIPQESSFNTTLPLKVKDYLNFYAHFFKQDERKIYDVLERVHLSHKIQEKFSQLSGGEKQRVLLARTLLSKSKLIILDEPTKGLDSKGQDDLIGLIKKLKKDENVGIVIVDHNISQLIGDCDKILCLNQTHHWHDQKNLMTKNVLQSIYQCELEHILIHENFSGCHHQEKEKKS